MGGINSHMGLQLPPLRQEGPCSFQNSPEKLLHSSVGIAPAYLSLNICVYPSESFSGFRNRGPEPVTTSMKKYRSISLGPLAHAGFHLLLENVL